MGKVWVLDTEAKGTGAQMVPLEKALKRPAAEPVRRRARPVPQSTRTEAPAEPTPPRRFRVIDALSRQVLAEDANAPETLGVLSDAEQPVEVSVYVWEPKPETWRLLTSREKALLWELRRRPRAPEPVPAPAPGQSR